MSEIVTAAYSGYRRRDPVRADQGQEHRLHRRIPDRYRHRPQGGPAWSPDDEDEIVAALNALRNRYTYVFTTGGIGPTHDDITADSVAKAFGVGDRPSPARSLARFRERWTEAGPERGAPAHGRIPDGAELVASETIARARLQDRQCHRDGRRAVDHAGDAGRASRPS